MAESKSSTNSPNAPDFYIIDKSEKRFRDDSQWEIGKLVRRITQQDWAAAYYNYPFRSARNKFDESPDIVLLHADIGLIVITCRGYSIEDIEQVTNEDWEINGEYDRPIPEVQEQLAHVQSQITGVPDLMDFRQYGEVMSVVALPNISQSEWNDAGFRELNANLFFEAECNDGVFKRELIEIAGDISIPDEKYKKARKRLNQGDILSADRDPIRKERLTHTRSNLYRSAARGFQLYEQDKQQEQIGLHIPPGPQQIRGIAGSGKTTIMAKKAAVMHWKHEDWKIAFTFNTRSLYQTIENSILDFYRDFSNGQDLGDNINILHGWGKNPKNADSGERAEGLYRKLAIEAGIEPYRVAKGSPGFPDLNTHCADLVTSSHDIPQIYDAILIDEAQDFGPAFYRMCYDALKEPKRLIWAYDEAQTLNNLSAPSPKIIFHEDDADHRSVDLSGFYPGPVRKSFVMRQSYRTPRDILMAAHALGMGLYRTSGIVHTLTTARDWDAIGYQVDDGCSFSDIGSEIRISRDRDLSPHPLQSQVEPGELLSYSFHESIEAEAEEVVDRVIRDIQDENLDPGQIMIVCIGPKDHRDSPSINHARNVRAKTIADKLNQKASSTLDKDTIAHLAGEGSRDEFWKNGGVTVASSMRAKGNEAASVYVTGAELIAESKWKDNYGKSNLSWSDNYVNIRNEIFIGLTRSEGWCHVSGVGDPSNNFLSEISKVHEIVSEDRPEFVFNAPNPSEMTGEILIDETVPKADVDEP